MSDWACASSPSAQAAPPGVLAPPGLLLEPPAAARLPARCRWGAAPQGGLGQRVRSFLSGPRFAWLVTAGLCLHSSGVLERAGASSPGEPQALALAPPPLRGLAWRAAPFEDAAGSVAADLGAPGADLAASGGPRSLTAATRRPSGSLPSGAGSSAAHTTAAGSGHARAAESAEPAQAQAEDGASAPSRSLNAEGVGDAGGAESAATKAAAADAGHHAHAEDEEGAHEGEHEAEQEDALPFLLTAIGAGTLLLHCTTIPIFQFLQQTVVVFLLGIAYSLLIELAHLDTTSGGIVGVSYQMWLDINPQLLLAVMLPVLIAGDAMSIDTCVAKRVAGQCLYLAGPGVLVCSMTLAGFIWVYTAWVGHNWSFLLCLTMASILAATDPVAVVSLLKELGASPTLTVQIQGESLLNDGTAIVLYTVAYNMLRGVAYTAGDVIVFLVKAAVCAVILGLVIGFISVYWIRKSSFRLDKDRSSLIQISITLCCAYFSFIAAEGTFEVSGVLCCVASSLALADQMWPSIVSKEAMHNVWHMLEHVGNSVIFFVAGALTGNIMTKVGWEDYCHLLVFYVVGTVIRGAMIFLSIPVLNAVGNEPVTTAEAAVMCWGGLRGALGLALAIQVSLDRADGMVSPEEAQHVLFYVAGIAFMTLCVNATTSPALVKRLKLNRPSGTKQMMVWNLKRQMADLVDSNHSNVVRDQLKSMIEEIDRTVPIDPSIAEAITKMHAAGDGAPDAEAAGCSEPACWAEESSSLSRLDRCCQMMGRRRRTHDGSLTEVKDLKDNFEEAQQLFSQIPEDIIDLLHLPRFAPMMDRARQQEAIHMLMADGANATPLQMHPINDVFLSLVEAKIWEGIHAGETRYDEGKELLDCIAAARPRARCGLTDLKHLRSHLIVLHDRDLFAQEATAMPQGAASVKMGDGVASVRIPDETRLHKALTSPAYMTVISVLSLLTSAASMYIAISSEVGETTRLGVWSVLITTLFNLFSVDVALRMCAQGFRFFASGWNKLDFLLSLLAAIGLILEVMLWTMSPDIEIWGTNISQWIQAVACFQVLRVHHLSRSVRTLRGLRKLAKNSHISQQMKAICMLKAFAVAHAASQEDLIRYFGKSGSVGSSLVARCLVESATEVYKACVIAHLTSELVKEKHNIMAYLFELQNAIGTTRNLCSLVEQAHSCGAMTEEDCESLLHPLKHHMKELSKMRKNARLGVIPFIEDFCKAGPAGAAGRAAVPPSPEWTQVASENLARVCHAQSNGSSGPRGCQAGASVETQTEQGLFRADGGQCCNAAAQTQPEGVFLELSERKVVQLLSGLREGAASCTTQTDSPSKRVHAEWHHHPLPLAWACGQSAASPNSGTDAPAKGGGAGVGRCWSGRHSSWLRAPGDEDDDSWSVDSDDVPAPRGFPHGAVVV